MLLIRRGHAPGADLWSLPGGRVKAGEDDQAAVIREISEETGLIVTPGAFLGGVMRPAPGGDVFDIRDYEATVTGGALAAGDDAAEVGWFIPADLAEVPLTPGLVEALVAWHVLAGEGDARSGSGPEPPGGR